MINTTQDHISIKNIEQDLAIMKNGDVALVLQTSAVNFGLLSENEQIAIISAFAGLLNSLSFSIQIVIRSKRLNISNYLELLDEARSKQPNPLLSQMMLRYRSFIEQTIRENEILDKKFFVVIALGSLEVGFSSSREDRLNKAQTMLKPRRDHIIRQLATIGLQAKQLTSFDLLRLYYDIYNPEDDSLDTQATPQVSATPPVAQATPPAPVQPTPQPVTPPPTPTPTPIAPQTSPQSNEEIPPFGPIEAVKPIPQPTIVFNQPLPPVDQAIADTKGATPPQPLKLTDDNPNPSDQTFVVEELQDEYHGYS